MKIARHSASVWMSNVASRLAKSAPQMYNIADDQSDAHDSEVGSQPRKPWADMEPDADGQEILEFDSDGNYFTWNWDHWGAFKEYDGGYTRVYTESYTEAASTVSETKKEEQSARRETQASTANVESTRKYINQCAQDSRTIDFKVDSGAAVSVAPIDLFKEYKLHPTYESENKIPYTVANGQKVYEAGVRWPVFREVTTGKLLRFPVRAANVRSNLLAPFDLANMGIRTVLDDSEPHLLDKRRPSSKSISSGEVAHRSFE